jgi:hypothetical protein
MLLGLIQCHMMLCDVSILCAERVERGDQPPQGKEREAQTPRSEERGVQAPGDEERKD